MDGWDHAADDSYQTQNDRRHGQAAQVDAEVDVSGLQVVAEGAHQGGSADGPGNDVSDGDSSQASGEGDGESFGEKLEKDVRFVSAKSFLDTDFAGALLYRDQ